MNLTILVGLWEFILFPVVQLDAEVVLNDERDVTDVIKTYDELEPGETKVPSYVDYCDATYISPPLTLNKQNEINERFNLMRCKSKPFRNQSDFFLLIFEIKLCNDTEKWNFSKGVSKSSHSI